MSTRIDWKTFRSLPGGYLLILHLHGDTDLDGGTSPHPAFIGFLLEMGIDCRDATIGCPGASSLL